MLDFIQWLQANNLQSLSAIATLVSFLFAVYSLFSRRGRPRGLGRMSFVVVALGGVLTILASIAALLSSYKNIFHLIDTPREVLVVVGSLILILASIACTIYFRPTRMTVIAGVALGFIAAALFAEGVFAAQDYMNRRLDVHKQKAFIGSYQRS